MTGFRMFAALVVIANVPRWATAQTAHAARSPQAPAAVSPVDTARSLPAAAATLRAAPWFTSAYIGPSAVLPEQVRAWGVVLRSRAADSTFKDLLRTGTPAGQLYALTGIYLTDSAYFRQRLAEYRARTDTVHLLAGCFEMGPPIGALVSYLADGRWAREFRTAQPPPRR